MAMSLVCSFFGPPRMSIRMHISGTTVQTSRNFLCLLPVAVARSSSGGVTVCYALSVFWMTPYLQFAHNGQKQATQKGLVI